MRAGEGGVGVCLGLRGHVVHACYLLYGLGFGVWGLVFGVWGLGFGIWDLGFGV